ncbi:MAG: hypothetical protein JWP04_937, partial [Belnapia sp.]|nr:hypothetical protein [Belnapia sp.]
MPDQDGTGAGQRGGQPGPASARLSPVRLHQAVLAVALLVPAAVFAAAAWWNRGEVLADGADAVERTVAVMQEHVGKVLDTTDLILDRLEDHLRGRDQAAVAAAETSAFLVRLKAPFDQIVSIWVSGPDGHVLAGTQDWDRSVTITDREFFRVHLDRERSDGVNQTGGVNQDGARGASHVSAPFNGRATTAPSFAISRRRSGPDGRFEGVIHVAFSPAYFTRFFAGIAPPFAHAAGLVRADGEILAQDPPIGRPTRLGPASLLRGMPRDDTPAVALMGMAPDHIGPERIMVHRQVGRWPVRVYFAAQPEAMLGRWRQNLRAYGLVAGAAAVTLLAVAWLALRQAR